MSNIDVNTRYGSAWSEHNARLEQRQSAVQLYLAVASVLFGFYFNSRANGNLKDHSFEVFALLIGVTFLTICTSSFLFLQNRVIQRIAGYLRACEDADSEIGRNNKGLYYWANKNNQEVIDKFHSSQRLYHRVLLSSILSLTNFAAFFISIYELYPNINLFNWILMSFLFVSSGTSIIFNFMYLSLDKGDDLFK